MKTLRHLLSLAHLLKRRMAVLLFFLMAGALNAGAQGCQAWFMYSVDTTVSPNTVALFDSSFGGAGTITTYQWHYNGSPVGTNSPSQTIQVSNVHTGDFICLTITTDSGCTSTWCDTVVLGGGIPCNGMTSFTYSFDSTGTYYFMSVNTGFTFPVTYLWQSSNGHSATTSTFNTQFTSPGFYNVCLTVTDANGCTATYCDSINVQNPANCQGCSPHVYYTHDSLNVYTFHDTTTYLTPPTSNSWQINGVNYGSGSSVTATFTSPNTTYYVCRTAIVAGCDTNCSTYCFYVQTGQIPGISVQYFDGDSMSYYCTAPQSVGMYVYGYVSGYPLGDTTIGIHINFDDGTDTSFLAVNMQNYYYTYLAHAYQNPGTYSPQIIVYSPDSLYSDTAILAHPIVITNTCGSVGGHVYLDNNQNCIFDTGDTPLAHRPVYLTNGSGIYQYTYTDVNGVYSFNVPTGQTYTIRVDTSGNWHSGSYTSVCPTGGVLTVSTVPSANNNFFLSCPAGFDLSAYASGWGFVPGRYGSICVYPFDHRCGTPNGQIMMVFDPSMITVLPDSSGGYSLHGDTVIWNITGGAGNGYYQSLCVPVRTSTSATIGDSVCVTVIINPVVGDSVPSNNTVTRCWAVRSSWDPNDKAATPEGAGVNHAIRPETELTYTIRFQNTGNASAQDIFILDTLDASFDAGTLEVLASSHPMVPTVLTGNILRFAFNNINLPDSNANEQLSHGYVMYSISPKVGVTNGAVIHNTAGIYFDFNPPVITNTTFHTVDFTLAVHQPQVKNSFVTVYPNPASNVLHIRLAKSGRTEINLYDISGRMVLHQQMLESGTVDVKSLPAGSYKVQVLREEGIQNSSLVIVR